MRSKFTLAVSLILCVACARLAPAADKKPEPKVVAADFELSLSVVHSLEDGPLVCTVKLKNIGKVMLLNHYFESKGAYCRCRAKGKLRKEPVFRGWIIHGIPGPYVDWAYPGGTTSMTFYLHKGYLDLPAGKAEIEFGWVISEATWNGEHGGLKQLFELKGKRTVEILPVTKPNLNAALQKIETEFAEVAKKVESETDYHSSNHNPDFNLVSTIVGCRHKEFVPLIKRIIDKLPASASRQDLIGTVYESYASPEEGFDTLMEYLESTQPVAATDIFDYWERQNFDFRMRASRLEELKKPLVKDIDPKKVDVSGLMRDMYKLEEEAWLSSKRHLDTRPTKEQIRRLSAIKNVWVRALLYAEYPKECSDVWVKALLDELKQVGRPPARYLELFAQLDDDRFLVRDAATKELIKHGSEYALHYWGIPESQLKPEVARRLDLVKQQVKKPELPRLWTRTISHLVSHNGRHARDMASILAKENPPTTLSHTAQEAIQKNQEFWKRMEAQEKAAELQKKDGK